MDLSAFKAYDIRGLYPEQVNEDLAYLVGRAFVRFLGAKTIVVGRDMRESSPLLMEKLLEGASCEGADIIDIGLCTTPMLSFAVANYGYDGGVMISASHNPKEYNAFKLISKNALPLDETYGLPEIKNLIKKGFGNCRTRGAVTKKEILGDYLGHILKRFDGLCHKKIVVDYGNGVGAVSGKAAFARFDFDVTSLNEEPDGNFPNHPANPHETNNFNQLINEVRNKKADLGIFFDGDADRAAFVDENGGIVPIDLLAVLLANEELSAKPEERIYFDLRFSKAVPDAIKKSGGVPVMMRVGNPFYKKALTKEGGILGAEFSGHIMFAENYGIDDGLFATLKVLKMLCQKNKPVSQLIDGIKKYEASPEISVVAGSPETVLEKIKNEFPEAKTIELDGLYLDFNDGFISVRQSQTEPEIFRARVEAKTIDELNTRLHKVLAILKG